MHWDWASFTIGLAAGVAAIICALVLFAMGIVLGVDE